MCWRDKPIYSVNTFVGLPILWLQQICSFFQNYGASEKDQPPIESIPNAVEIEQQQQQQESVDKIQNSELVRKDIAVDKSGNNAIEENRFELPAGSEQPDAGDNNADVVLAVVDNSAAVAEEQNPAAGVASANTSVAEAITVPGDDMELRLRWVDKYSWRTHLKL